MAKLSKASLKMIVKECLVEILQEGLMTSTVMSESARRQPVKKKRQRKVASPKGTSLDNIRFDNNEPQPNKDFEKNVYETAKSMTSDPVLSSILADTAMTTLQEQTSAESRGAPAAGSDRAAMTAARSNPDELFAESASKWADLAFASPVNKSPN